MVISYNKLIDFVTSFADQHLQVKRFKAEFEEQLPNFSTEGSSFPLLFMSPLGSLLSTNVDYFTVRVWCLDIIEKDRANINHITSDTHLILNDLKKYIKDGSDYVFDILRDPSPVPINNALGDYVGGWYVDLDIEVTTYCVDEIPLDPITGSTASCLPVSILDSDGVTEYEVNSGGSFVCTPSYTDPTGTRVPVVNQTNPNTEVEWFSSVNTTNGTGTFEKTSGTDNGYDAQSKFLISTDNDFKVEFRFNTLANGSMCGVSGLYDIGNYYGSIAFAYYIQGGQLYVYTYGQGGFGLGVWDETDLLTIARENGNMNFYVNNGLGFSLPLDVIVPNHYGYMMFDSSLQFLGAQVNDILLTYL
jgi:hypothetical protein